MATIRSYTLLCLPLLWAATAFAADSTDWAALAALRKGHKLQVVKTDMKRVEGRLVSVSESSIVLHAGKRGEVTIAKEDVVRVGSLEKSKRWRNALYGAGIGAGVGYLIGVAGTHKKPDDWESIRQLSTVVGLGIGAGTGAAIPSRPTLYRAPIATTAGKR